MANPVQAISLRIPVPISATARAACLTESARSIESVMYPTPTLRATSNANELTMIASPTLRSAARRSLAMNTAAA